MGQLPACSVIPLTRSVCIEPQAAGSERAGYRVHGEPCTGQDQISVYERNRAHSCMFGLMMEEGKEISKVCFKIEGEWCGLYFFRGLFFILFFLLSPIYGVFGVVFYCFGFFFGVWSFYFMRFGAGGVRRSGILGIGALYLSIEK